MSKSNPRWANGTLRRKHRARFKAMDAPCGICRGRFGPIHYDEPSDAEHPLSFVIDEKIPVSKAYLYGYDSERQAAHYFCNQRKSNKLNFSIEASEAQKTPMPQSQLDSDW